MADHKKKFADRLLAQQSMNSELQENYRKEMQDMLEVKIEGKRKAIGIVLVSVWYVIGLLLLHKAIYAITMLEMFRYAFGIVALTLIARSVLGVMIIIKGVFVYRTHGNISTAIYVYGFAGAALILLQHGLDVQPIYMVVAGFILLAFACLGLIINLIKQSKLNTRERELMQEYNRAEIAPEN